MIDRASPRLRRALTAVLMAGLAALFGLYGVGARLDDRLYDLHLATWPQPPDEDVVVVAIDDRSLAELGQWPWPRDLHARLLDRLGEAGVRGVALDLILAEPDRNGPERDLALAAALRRGGRIALPVFPAPLHPNGPPVEVLPTPTLAAAAPALGHTDVELDAEGAVRGLYLHAGVGDAHWPALALALLRLDPAARPQELPGLRRPAEQAGSPYQWVRDRYVRIRYAGPPGSFPQVSAAAVLAGEVPDRLLRGRWTVVGVTATGLAPTFLTPMSAERMTGAEYQANVVEMLLHGRAIVPLAPPWQAALGAAIVLVATWYLLAPGLARPLLAGALGALVALAGSALLLRLASLWFAPAATVVAIGLVVLAWTVSHLRLWRRQAHLDTLTHLPNRRRFDLALERELASARRNRTPLSLLLIDVDHFKTYNDSQGHRAGDRLLVMVARSIRAHARRPRDLAARFGGDEFALILPDTPLAGALRVAEAVLAEVRELDLRYGPGDAVRASVSIGLQSCVPDAATLPRTLFDRADQALYRAKEAGRDTYAAYPAL